MPRLPRLAPALLVSLLSAPAAADPLPIEPPYALDAVPRHVAGCPKIAIAAYGGDVLKLSPTLWINADFQRHVRAFGRVQTGGIQNEPVYTVGFSIGLGPNPWIRPGFN